MHKIRPERFFFFHLLPLFAWITVIYLLSDEPKVQSDMSAGKIGMILIWLGFPEEWVMTHTFHFVIRKIAHLTEYAILFLLARNVLRFYVKRPRLGVYSVVFCVLFAISDEIHQSFVPGRTAQISDVFIDSLGACMGWIFMGTWQRFQFPRRWKNWYQKSSRYFAGFSRT